MINCWLDRAVAKPPGSLTRPVTRPPIPDQASLISPPAIGPGSAQARVVFMAAVDDCVRSVGHQGEPPAEQRCGLAESPEKTVRARPL